MSEALKKTSEALEAIARCGTFDCRSCRVRRCDGRTCLLWRLVEDAGVELPHERGPRVPFWVREGLPVEPFILGTPKEGAVKVLKEAAETYSAWEDVRDCANAGRCDECAVGDGCDIVSRLGSELADVVQAAANMAARYGIDLAHEMELRHERNSKRGRYANES